MAESYAGHRVPKIRLRGATLLSTVSGVVNAPLSDQLNLGGILQRVCFFVTSLFCFVLAVAIPGPPGPPGQPGLPGSRNLVSIIISVSSSFCFGWVSLELWLQCLGAGTPSLLELGLHDNRNGIISQTGYLLSLWMTY